MFHSFFLPNKSPTPQGDIGHHSNFFEFASGGDPTDPSDDRLLDLVMTVREESGNMIMTYQYRRLKAYASAGLVYTVYHCDDLVSWSSEGVSEVETSDIEGKDDYELVTVEITIPTGSSGSTKQFARLLIEQM